MTMTEKEKKIESQLKRFKRLSEWGKHLQDRMNIDEVFCLSMRIVSVQIKLNWLMSQKPFENLKSHIEDGGITIATDK